CLHLLHQELLRWLDRSLTFSRSTLFPVVANQVAMRSQLEFRVLLLAAAFHLDIGAGDTHIFFLLDRECFRSDATSADENSERSAVYNCRGQFFLLLFLVSSQCRQCQNQHQYECQRFISSLHDSSEP